MMRDVIIDERGDEVVAVIIAILHAHLDLVGGALRSSLERLWLELLLQEFVICALIDEYIQGRSRVALHKVCSIVGLR